MVNANPAANAFYSTQQIAWGSLLGGPFTGAYFLAHNFRLMGRPRYAKRCWWISAILFIIVFVLGGPAYLGTSVSRSLGSIVLFTIIATAVAHQMQQPSLEQQAAAGRKRASNVHVFITSIIGAVITVLAIIVLSYLMLFLLLFLYPQSQGHF